MFYNPKSDESQRLDLAMGLIKQAVLYSVLSFVLAIATFVLLVVNKPAVAGACVAGSLILLLVSNWYGRQADRIYPEGKNL